MTKPSYEELERELESWRSELYPVTALGKQAAPSEVAEFIVDLTNLAMERKERAEAAETSLARVRGLLQHQWISVEERLPEDFMQCLIFGHGPDDEGFEVGQIMEAGYNMDGEWHPHRDMKFPITHWMPLPALPTILQSSSLVPEGAESADIGKIATADKSGVEMGKVNRVDSLSQQLDALVAEHADDCKKCDGTGFEHIVRTTVACRSCHGTGKVAGSAETGGEKAAPSKEVVPLEMPHKFVALAESSLSSTPPLAKFCPNCGQPLTATDVSLVCHYCRTAYVYDVSNHRGNRGAEPAATSVSASEKTESHSAASPELLPTQLPKGDL